VVAGVCTSDRGMAGRTVAYGLLIPDRRRGDSRIEEMMARVRGLVENVRGLNKLVMQLAEDLYTLHEDEEGHRPRKGSQ